jgi:hypothetical protein
MPMRYAALPSLANALHNNADAPPSLASALRSYSELC